MACYTCGHSIEEHGDGFTGCELEDGCDCMEWLPDEDEADDNEDNRD